MAGIDEVTPHVQVEGLDEAAQAFQKLGESGEKAFNQIGEAANSVSKVGQIFNSMSEDGAKAFNHIAEVGAEAFAHILASAAQGNFTGLVTYLFGEIPGAITEAVASMAEFIDAQAQVIETLSNLATATGMSTSEILGMREAFASVGISTTGFERSIGRLAITIAKDWSEIQQSIRTSSDAQTGAMQRVAQTAFDVQKAYTAMNTALGEASRSAAHDAVNIEEAALSLQRAQAALASAALESRANALGVEGAKLALIRAQMNLAKDSGQAVNPADEKALKIEQDKLAVKQAQLQIEEAQKKQQNEGLDLKAKQLAVEKAQMEVEDAKQKRADDAIKNAERIEQARLNIDKAQLAAREAQEKAHEQELKDIPKIAAQIDEVVKGTRDWADVNNKTEISAQNMTKALIKAASLDGKPPDVKQVFSEMSTLFQKMGNDAEASNLKMALIQRTMGAGFQAGQASAAQLMAVLERGPAAVQHFLDEMKEFGKSIDLKQAEDQLKSFNSAFAQLEGTVDILKSKFAGLLAVPLTPFFNALRESITTPGADLNKLANAAFQFVEALMRVVSAVGSAVAEAAGPAFHILIELLSRALGAIAGLMNAVVGLADAFSKLTGFSGGEVLGGWATAAALASSAIRGIAASIALVVARMAGWMALIGLVVTALGNLYAAYLMVFKGQSELEAHKNSIEQAGKQILSNATFGLSDKIPGLGSDKKDDGTKAAADELKGSAAKTSDAANELKGAGTNLSQTAPLFGDAGTKLASAGDTMASAIAGAADRLLSAASALTSAAASLTAAKPAGAKAGGGMIRGPGGPRDDTAGLFALSDGEYVVQSAAVSHYGADLFEALNSLSVGGFATGGAVGSPRAPSIPASPNGGGSNVLNLTIDGERFNGLRAPDNVAAKLKTYAVGRQTSSTGRKPSWMK